MSTFGIPPTQACTASLAAHERVETLARNHLSAVWRTVRDLGVPPGDIEDAVQEVMVVVFRRLGDIQPGRERAFALATAARVAANFRRTRRRRPADPTAEIDERGVALAPGPHDPARVAESREEMRVVRAALDEMTEPQRVAFTLFELEELSAREIAEQLGVSEKVVFARVARARVVLRARMMRLRQRQAVPQEAEMSREVGNARR